MNAYNLNELGKIDVDSWVDAVSGLYDDPKAFRRIMELAADSEIENWLRGDRCPGELERAIGEYAAENGILFDEKGRII